MTIIVSIRAFPRKRLSISVTELNVLNGLVLEIQLCYSLLPILYSVAKQG